MNYEEIRKELETSEVEGWKKRFHPYHNVKKTYKKVDLYSEICKYFNNEC